MKKIILSIVMIVLFAFAVYGINSKSLEVPLTYQSNLANLTGVNTCDVAAFPDYYMTSLEYAGVYHVIIPDSQPFIIESTGNTCTPTTINAESNLSSAIETFENLMIYHYNADTVRVAEYNESGVTVLFTEKINNSMLNDGISCGHVLELYDRCYFLDDENVLHYVDITDKTSITLHNYTAFNGTRNVQGNTHIRVPLLTNFQSNNLYEINQIVFLDDLDGDGSDGLRLLNIDDFSAFGFGYKDDLSIDDPTFNLPQKQNFTTNPVAYTTSDGSNNGLPVSFGINKLYYGSINGVGASLINVSLNEIDVTSGAVTPKAFNNDGAVGYRDDGLTPYYSIMSEPFLLRNQSNAFICTSTLSQANVGSAKQIVLLCYNPTTTEVYQTKTTPPFYATSHNFIPYNNRIFPMIMALQIEIDNFLSGNYQYWSFGLPVDPNVYGAFYCSQYYDYGLQQITCTYPPSRLITEEFNYGLYLEQGDWHMPTFYPITNGNVFGALFYDSPWEGNANVTLSTFPAGINNLHTNRFSFFEDLNGDGLGDYVYTYSTGITRFVYSTYENQPPSLMTVSINADSNTLCLNQTYTFNVIYSDPESDQQQYRYKCKASDLYTNWTAEEYGANFDVNCLTDTVGATRFYVDLKQISEATARLSYSIPYTVINDDGSSGLCSLAGSGTTTPSGESSGEGAADADDDDSSDTFGMDEIADAAHWGVGQKKLAVILLFIIVGLMGLYTSHNKSEGGFNPIGGAITVFAMVGIIYFFFSIGWIGGFFLTLIGIVAAALIVYGVFMSRNAGG